MIYNDASMFSDIKKTTISDVSYLDLINLSKLKPRSNNAGFDETIKKAKDMNWSILIIKIDF